MAPDLGCKLSVGGHLEDHVELLHVLCPFLGDACVFFSFETKREEYYFHILCSVSDATTSLLSSQSPFSKHHAVFMVLWRDHVSAYAPV